MSSELQANLRRWCVQPGLITQCAPHWTLTGAAINHEPFSSPLLAHIRSVCAYHYTPLVPRSWSLHFYRTLETNFRRLLFGRIFVFASNTPVMPQMPLDKLHVGTQIALGLGAPHWPCTCYATDAHVNDRRRPSSCSSQASHSSFGRPSSIGVAFTTFIALISTHN